MMSKDDSRYLNLLGWAHYIFGALTMLCGSTPLVHLLVGIRMVTRAMPGPPWRSEEQQVMAVMGSAFILIAITVIVLSWALGIATVFAGRYLRERRRRMFCTVVAAVNCMAFPVGTAIGVFRIVLLNKTEVRGVFDAHESV